MQTCCLLRSLASHKTELGTANLELRRLLGNALLSEQSDRGQVLFIHLLGCLCCGMSNHGREGKVKTVVLLCSTARRLNPEHCFIMPKERPEMVVKLLPTPMEDNNKYQCYCFHLPHSAQSRYLIYSQAFLPL